MANTACNFTHPTLYFPSRDITWSLKVCLCAADMNASGGFTTFVTKAEVITGGGIYGSLGYMPYNTTAGVSGNLVAAGFDNLGYFGLKSVDNTSGRLTPVANSYSIRTGEDYQYKSTTVLPFTLLKNTEVYTTLKFNLTNVGQTLKTYYLNAEKRYTLISSVSTGFVADLDTLARVGVSYSSPLRLNENKALLRVKDLHVQGLQAF